MRGSKGLTVKQKVKMGTGRERMQHPSPNLIKNGCILADQRREKGNGRKDDGKKKGWRSGQKMKGV